MNLQELYKEREVLLEKLQAIEHLITIYGGELEAKNETDYPISAGWRQKILFILRKIGQPVPVEVIRTHLAMEEPNANLSNINQYCSQMAKSGEIGVKEGDYKNSYYYKG